MALKLFHHLTEQIPSGENLNEQNAATGETALMIACRLGDFTAAHNLLDLGADATTRALDGTIALHWLFMFDEQHTMKLAQRLTENWRIQSINCTSIRPVAMDEQLPIILHGTPLSFAVMTCSTPAVQALLTLSADPAAGAQGFNEDWGDFSALYIAVCLHLDAILSLLCKYTDGVRPYNPLYEPAAPYPGNSKITPSMSNYFPLSSRLERHLIHSTRHMDALRNTCTILQLYSRARHRFQETPTHQSNEFQHPKKDNQEVMYQPLENAFILHDHDVISALLVHYYPSNQRLPALNYILSRSIKEACIGGATEWENGLPDIELALHLGADINELSKRFECRPIDYIISRSHEKALKWIL
ncbi:hypothetical protein H2202_010916 [Exophiala xenobiotica]|nr:hypothetical protein H2202_010916 [Exophiala xenobiotica]